MNITRKHVEQGLVIEHEPHHFSAEASELRMSRFPSEIDTELGNGLKLVMHNHERRDGDLLWISYRQELGCMSLRVFND